MKQQDVQNPYPSRNNNMIECRHCYAKIDKRAKVCPFCRKQQKKSRIGSFCILVILLLIALVLLVTIISLYPQYKLTENARIMSEYDYKVSCVSVTYDEMMHSNDGMKGTDITLSGKIIQDAGNDIYRLSVEDPDGTFGTDAVLCKIRSELKIAVDDEIVIYGTSLGFKSYTAVLGNTITVPYIYVSYYDVIEIIPAPTDIQNITDESTHEGTESQQPFNVRIVAGESNEYSELLTLNAGSEFEETQYVYYLPPGSYEVTNGSDNAEQISVYSRETHITDEGWEEPAETVFIALLDAGESTDIVIGEDEYIEIHEPSVIYVVSK